MEKETLKLPIKEPLQLSNIYEIKKNALASPENGGSPYELGGNHQKVRDCLVLRLIFFVEPGNL